MGSKTSYSTTIYTGFRFSSTLGIGGGYGFDRITEIGAAIEEAAKRKDSEEIKRQLSALKDYLDRVEVRYE